MNKALNKNRSSRSTDWYRFVFSILLLVFSTAFQIIRSHTPHLNGGEDALSILAGLGLLFCGVLLLVCLIVLAYRLMKQEPAGKISNGLCWVLMSLSTALLLASAAMTCQMSVLSCQAL